MTADRYVSFGPVSVAAYHDRLLAKLDLPKPAAGAAMLDLGCGEGRFDLKLADLGWRVEAMDISADPRWEAMAAAAGGRVHFAAGDAQALPFADASFDLVFQKDMLHHASDPAQALREMARVCRPGGQVVLCEANRLNPIFYVHLTLLGEHDHFTRRTLERLLAEAGLAGHTLRRAEARVWPLEGPRAQRLMGSLQDLAEALPPARPFLTYHLVRWSKPR